MAMGEDPAPNLAKAIDGVRDAAKRGAQLVVLPELFRSRYFCQSEDAAQFELAEAIPGPSTEVLGQARGRAEDHARREPVREARGRPLSQHGGRARRRAAAISASTARCTSPTIRGTTRSTTSRRAISGFKVFRHEAGAARRARLLGPVVSRSRAADGDARRRDPRLSDGDRLAPRGEGAVRRAAARRVGDDPAQPRRSRTAASSSP